MKYIIWIKHIIHFYIVFYFSSYILKIFVFIKICNILIPNKISSYHGIKITNTCIKYMYKIKLYDSYIFEKFIKSIHAY